MVWPPRRGTQPEPPPRTLLYPGAMGAKNCLALPFGLRLERTIAASLSMSANDPVLVRGFWLDQ